MENDNKHNKDKIDFKKMIVMWFLASKKFIGLWVGKMKVFVIKNPLVSAGSLIGILIFFLILGSLGGNPSSQSSLPGGSTSIPLSSTPSSETPTTSIAPVEVTVTFDTQGGSSLAPITGTSGQPIVVNLTTTKFAHIFTKFSSDSVGSDTLTLTVFPNASLTVYAIWEAELFNVEFLTLNGSLTNYQIDSFATLYINDAGELFGLGRNTSGIFGNGQISSTIITTPVALTSFLPLHEGEFIVDLRVNAIKGSGVVSLLLTNQHRLLFAGSNYILTDGTQSQVTNVTTYKDITASLNLAPGETITKLMVSTEVQMIRTSSNRFIAWGMNVAERLFPQPADVASHLPVGTPTDVTALLTQSLLPGEDIELIELLMIAGVLKTTNNRYFIWGRNSSFALLMFQPQNTTINTPLDITTNVLNLIGSDHEIELFVPQNSSFTMNFITSNKQVYNYGDYRFIFLPNTTDRPTFQGANFFGDTTPLNMVPKFDLAEGEYPTHVLGGGFVTNLRRFYPGSDSSGNNVAALRDFNPLLREGETITATFGHAFESRFVTNLGRVFGASQSTNYTNLTSVILTEQSLSTLPLPYNSIIDYVPVRSGFTFIGWFTDKNLTTPFTGTVPANNNLKLYGRFVAALS
jgi:uncharacterized repeat protein (TIGR02543 family)